MRDQYELTESRHPLSDDLDALNLNDLFDLYINDQKNVFNAIEEARKKILSFVQSLIKSFNQNGRLIYVGCGTSGRIGVLDASECPPTFGSKPNQVLGIIAGGIRALYKSVEGAEDDALMALKQIKKIKLKKEDIVLGISANGQAPFVLECLRHAKSKKCTTGLLTNNVIKKFNFIDHMIEVHTGQEILTGSTRLKAGSAAKIILNFISTAAFIKTGHSFGNLMVDLNSQNQKLIKRSIQILKDTLVVNDQMAAHQLKKAKGSLKTAILMKRTNIDHDLAVLKLKKHKSNLRKALLIKPRFRDDIKAVIFDMDGTLTRYHYPGGFSSWAALGHAYGLEKKMKLWVNQYHQGKISYMQIWKNTAKELKGLPTKTMHEHLFCVGQKPPMIRGALDTIKLLSLHFKTGIISSGLWPLAKYIQKQSKMDFIYANHFEEKNGAFTGKVSVMVHHEKKHLAFKSALKKHNLLPHQVCYIGDSIQDAGILKLVKLPLVFRNQNPALLGITKHKMLCDHFELLQLLAR